MKKWTKLLVVLLAMVTMSSIVAFAEGSEYNKSHIFSFIRNEEKKQSPGALKPPDGDPLCYVTTLSSYDGVSSTVFKNGGIFYARSRYAGNSDANYSNLLTFTSNTAKTTTYTERPYYGMEYKLWTETENAQYGNGPMLQAVRWCP